MTRKQLIAELRRMGVTRVFNRPLSYCTRDELEYVFNQVSSGEKPHLSFSQISLYQKCPRQFYYRYIRGIKIPPPGSAVVGKATHKAIEVDLKTALKEGKHESWSVIEDIYALTFKEEKEKAVWDNEKPDEAFKQGRDVLKIYANKHLPKIEPETVEEKFEIPLPSLGSNLVGIIDLVDSTKTIIEHKTTTRSYPESKISNAQLFIYAMVKNLKKIGFNVLVRRKNPTVQILRGEVKEEDIYRTLADILHVANCIYLLSFPPAQQGTWICSPKWCGYWEICRSELQNEVKELLEEEINYLKTYKTKEV